MEPDFVAIVENTTGRAVKAFVSQVHLSTDMAFELFVFEPRAVTVLSPASEDGAVPA